MNVQNIPLLKQASIETIKRLPDRCSIDDIMYEINFVAQVYEGLNDADNGNMISTGELLKRVEQWQK
jgi:predicted transcriptional regulator